MSLSCVCGMRESNTGSEITGKSTNTEGGGELTTNNVSSCVTLSKTCPRRQIVTELKIFTVHVKNNVIGRGQYHVRTGHTYNIDS